MQDVTLSFIAEFAPELLNPALDAIMVTNCQGIIQWVNPRFSALTGYSASEAIGNTPRLLSSGVHSQGFYQAMWQPLLQQGFWQGDIWNKRKNGQIYPQKLTINAIYNAQQQVCAYAAFFTEKQTP
ncbi:hypothetical protein WG68_12740 [Arsukibacterium ikkense]|uniref:PAS domain-containing protein n=1 Tax=Arsukibacterium ikkense TaxID=336831 RepID=A0A0M2V2Y1_9GAMM|nr:PAS domain-containing protein [Arsukibacterium ikkense]KKO45001.1 hypothetical protein WG68_12740 [Arsukibacterium ikkense]